MIYILIISFVILLLSALLIYLWRSKRLQVMPQINLTLPKGWAELSERQLVFVSVLMLHENTRMEILAKCFFYFAGIRVIKNIDSDRWLCWHRRRLFVIKNYEVHAFAKKLSFVVDSRIGIKPIAKLAGRHPVNARFEGVPFRQWMAAENYYQEFIYTRNEDALDRLCAVIYTDSEVFDDANIRRISRHFAKVDRAKKFTVFLVYAGLKDVFSVQFPDLFQKIQQHADSATPSNPPNMREYFNNMLHALNMGDVTKIADILAVDSWIAFDTLNRKARENKEMEDRLQRLKTKR